MGTGKDLVPFLAALPSTHQRYHPHHTVAPCCRPAAQHCTTSPTARAQVYMGASGQAPGTRASRGLRQPLWTLRSPFRAVRGLRGGRVRQLTGGRASLLEDAATARDAEAAVELLSTDISGDDSVEDDGNIPLLKIITFILPTMGIWLASPIMSLIDTGVVGTRSAIELAALGPATTLCDSLIYCFTFLAVATTNLLATALAKGEKKEAQKVVAHALAIALASGTVIALGVEAFGPPLVTAVAGQRSIEVVPASLRYARVRVLSAPFLMASMVAQAACLGAKDSVTPLAVVLVAGVCNAVGDWFAVCRLGMGIMGAGLATALAEVLSCFLLLRVVFKMQGERMYSLIKWPKPHQLKRFLGFAGPIFFALLGKVVCYSAMTTTVSLCGPLPLATHQVMLRVFFFFATLGESLSQTAQAFLPGLEQKEEQAVTAAATAAALGGKPPRKIKTPGQRMIRKIMGMGVVVGVLNAMAAGLVPTHMSGLFTNDARVAAAMKGLVPLLSWSLVTHACVMALEGILLAKRQLSYLARTYAVNTVLMLGFMRLVSSWGPERGLHGAWMGLVLLQVIRFVQFGAQLLWVKRGERRAARETAIRAVQAVDATRHAAATTAAAAATGLADSGQPLANVAPA